MKANSFFFALVASLSILTSFGLSSCSEDYGLSSGLSFSDMVIQQPAFLSPEAQSLVYPDSISKDNPIKVVVFGYLHCHLYTKLYETEAYFDDNKNLVFLDGNKYWLSDKLMSFAAYWPMDSQVAFDDYGRIIDGNCVICGHTLPVNKFFKPDITTQSYSPLILRPFSPSIDNTL
ncbi:MAG: hypothetical protein HDQ88_01440 [Clostridia bacterium]|nr:hypothetical protein [Clostridia bacterium]